MNKIQITQINNEPLGVCKFSSSDNQVHGIISVSDTRASILEWQSDKKGCSQAALMELREHYNHIRAVGIGSDESDPSWQYWLHMHSKGLVDSLEDDDNIEVSTNIAG